MLCILLRLCLFHPFPWFLCFYHGCVGYVVKLILFFVCFCYHFQLCCAVDCCRSLHRVLFWKLIGRSMLFLCMTTCLAWFAVCTLTWLLSASSVWLSHTQRNLGQDSLRTCRHPGQHSVCILCEGVATASDCNDNSWSPPQSLGIILWALCPSVSGWSDT